MGFFVHTIRSFEISFDPLKSARNLRDRGLPFERAADFAFETAIYSRDQRKEYPEVRIVALGLIGDRLHVLCFTDTDAGIRIISLRKANLREVKLYVQVRAADQD